MTLYCVFHEATSCTCIGKCTASKDKRIIGIKKSRRTKLSSLDADLVRLCAFEQYMMDQLKISPKMLANSLQLYWSKHLCSLCKFIPRNAVKIICGHILCYECAKQTLTQPVPLCPERNCGKPLTGHAGPPFFADPVIRREFAQIFIKCNNSSRGCPWTGKADDMLEHIETCLFGKVRCTHCSSWIEPANQTTHLETCPGLEVTYPLAEVACTLSEKMANSQLLNEHFSGESFLCHLQLMASSFNALSVSSSEEEIGLLETSLTEKDDIVASLQTRANELMEAQESLQEALTQFTEKVSTSSEEDDQDESLSHLENRSTYNGTYIWSLRWFSQLVDDARRGENVVILSPPFYTSRYGYKLCLRVYPPGVDNNLSIFIVVMKGEYDDLLTWPFPYKITIQLLNQEQGEDITQWVVPNPLSSSFKKPTEELNLPTGYPRFISLQRIRTNGFIKDDTVFIKAQVDLGSRRRQ